ncbi:MAG TPA: ribonuclease III [Anaerolineales bacterium]|nr:ribonuclease III [Anaerolineales bacterium]
MNESQGIPGAKPAFDEESRLGVKFKDLRLLTRALTHRSYINEHPEAIEDNERLEFLGDAVLDFLVGAWLYHRFPEMAEGDLTRLRSALVRTEQLAEFADQFDLESMMRLGRGEADGGGRERPALLCATFEAVVGALYLDQGIEAVRNFIHPVLAPVTEDILENRAQQDPKSRLQEWAQSNGHPAPSYRIISSEGPDHAKIFMVEVLVNGQVCGLGTGSSKHSATKAAAWNAIQDLGLGE